MIEDIFHQKLYFNIDKSKKSTEKKAINLTRYDISLIKQKKRQNYVNVGRHYNGH